jgi:hypothetical protein
MQCTYLPARVTCILCTCELHPGFKGGGGTSPIPWKIYKANTVELTNSHLDILELHIPKATDSHLHIVTDYWWESLFATTNPWAYTDPFRFPFKMKTSSRVY